MATPLRRLLDAATGRVEAGSPSPDTAEPDEEHPVTDASAPAAEHPTVQPAAIDRALHEGEVLELDGVQRLRVHLPRGSVDVVGRDEPGALVEVRDAGRPVPVRLEHGLLTVGATDAFGHGAQKAVITVSVQRDVPVEVGGTSASVLVSGMKHGVAVQTVSGDVVCDATAGPARLEGVSAELALREHEGAVAITTVSGPATVSGPVTRLEHRGVSGDLFLDLEAPDRVDVRTVSGEVVLRLDPDRPAQYDIDTVSGEVHLDGTDLHRVRGGHRGRWEAPGDEPVEVRVSTSSGSVRIVHAEAT